MPTGSLFRILLVLLSILLGAASAVCAADDAHAASDRLWREVDEQISQLRSELGFDRLSPGVREVLVKVPRERFVPARERHNAYANEPLPIGYGQTISQPLIVAVMTELLQVKRGDRIFELGTGSAYQAAVLDELGAEVYSVEIVPELGQRARKTLDELGHTAVNSRVGDGYFGWQEAAPFDAIIVTAASDHIPPPLLRQLKPGGRMLIPVGTRYATQKLVLVSRDERGAVRTRELLPVFFVPLTGQR